MKINTKKKLIISSYDDQKNPVYSGGGAYAVRQLAKRLAKKYEITVLTGTYKNAKNEIIDNAEYIRIGSDIFGHKIGQLIYQYSLLKYAIKEKFDIWIESTTPPFTFSLLPLFCKKPVISWVNMLCSFDMQRKYKLNFRYIEQELSKLYKYIVVPTNWVKKDIFAMNRKSRILTITQGTDKNSITNLTKKKNDNGNYILFMGRIEINQKGLDLLIKALALSKSKTRIIFAGKGSKNEESKLKNLILKYRVKNKIARIGKIQGVKKERLLKYAKTIIIPSRFETFSLIALEAIMHQKPVICFNIPQLRWIPEKFAIKITPFNYKKMAIAIDKINTSKIFKKISAHEKNIFIKKYDWDRTAGKFHALISQISL
ncbi:glycosyltransferase family 4 protein [Patescibacteria group bacterium]|nr:glycosyltransferase family 4 protein [Patescibacteria group bacterium]MBU4016006.1 glycosyltransferase family 4 protein [Patescibacteria group bacterium]MBU4099162.1 glycosyltransferase family 4 protein [Patescibacteria group bacterium]